MEGIKPVIKNMKQPLPKQKIVNNYTTHGSHQTETEKKKSDIKSALG
jgi:hypothetical protein